MRTRATPRPAPREGRRQWGRAQKPRTEDAYKAPEKPSEPSVCPQCNAVFHKGRWQWGPPPAGAKEELCQACHRINDKFPAGIVTLSGNFLTVKRLDILQLVRHQEAVEKREHPMNRIMEIEEEPTRIVIRTTDIHLPHRIGATLKRTFRGKLDTAYEEDGYFVRVDWCRDK